jgi:hypothetical protein
VEAMKTQGKIIKKFIISNRKKGESEIPKRPAGQR